jgi:hypothetical protein
MALEGDVARPRLVQSKLSIKLNMKNHIAKRVLGTAIVMTLLAVITQNASASITLGTPDAGSTSLLMAVACAGLAAVRRFMR